MWTVGRRFHAGGGLRSVKRLWAGPAALALLLVVVPALLGRCAGPAGRAARVGTPADLTVVMYRPDSQKLIPLPLGEYLLGVVAAEMGPEFEEEALKAQMVAARTHAVRRMRKFGGPGCPLHPLADVCGLPEYDQAYMDQERLRDKLGVIAAYRFWQRLAEAEAATRGLILTYDAAPIDAQYHATSGKYTEDAAAVWGQAVPYLRPVPDPYGQAAPKYTETIALTWADLARALDLRAAALPASTGAPPVTVLERTPGLRVARVQVGGTVLTGTEFRRRLSLRSTDFTVRSEGGKVLITTYGYGHGVGMSQWGANGMARAGYRYQAILAHYYRGTQLERIFGE